MRWPALLDHLRASGRVAREEEDRVVLVARFTDGGQEVLQEVIVSCDAAACAAAPGHGRPWLRVLAEVTGEEALAAGEAVAHNATLAAGALCTHEGSYWLRDSLPLDAVTFEVVDLLVGLIAHEAARLRRRRAGATEGTAAIDCWTE